MKVYRGITYRELKRLIKFFDNEIDRQDSPNNINGNPKDSAYCQGIKFVLNELKKLMEN
jgi:hypothetical protein